MQVTKGIPVRRSSIRDFLFHSLANCFFGISSLFLPNVYVLPPGKGRAVGVDVVVFMPVGSDDLFDFFDGSVTRNLRTHPAGNPSGCRAKSWASVPTCGHPTQICASYRGIKAVPGLSPIALAESTTVFPPSQLCLNVDNPQSESSSYVRPP